MECARCGKPIYQNKYGKWKHYPYCGNARPHEAEPKTEKCRRE